MLLICGEKEENGNMSGQVGAQIYARVFALGYSTGAEGKCKIYVYSRYFYWTHY